MTPSPFNPQPSNQGPPPNLPATPPNWPTAKQTPMLDSALALLQQPWDPFSRAQHEAVMNAWLIKYTQQSNAKKLAQYMQAWMDYKLNAERYWELGLPIPPFTIPAPTLDDVGPMPDGYWFGAHV